jgi:hypothetical protein
MLGTYFVLTLILFILTIVGVVWSYKGDIDTEIKNPLILAMENYQVYIFYKDFRLQYTKGK